MQIANIFRIAAIANEASTIYILPLLVYIFILPFTHTVAIRLVCLTAAFIFSLKINITQYPPKFPSKTALSLWIVICMLSVFWSISFQYSFGEFKNAVIYSMIAFATCFYSTTDIRVWNIFKNTMVLSLFTICIFGIVRFAHYHTWTITKSIGAGDERAFSTYLVIIFPILLTIIATYPKQSIIRHLTWVTIPMAAAAGFMTLNRMMWISVLAQSAIFIFLYAKKSSSRIFNRKAFLILTTSVCGLLIVCLVAVSQIRNRTGLLNTDKLVTSYIHSFRLRIWHYAFKRIAERPITGYGFGRGILRHDFIAHFNNNPLIWHAHNMVLNYALEAGVFGVLALLLLFGSLTRQFWRLYRSESRDVWLLGLLGLCLLAGVAIKAMTDDIIIREDALLLWSIFGMSLGLGGRLLARNGVDGGPKST